MLLRSAYDHPEEVVQSQAVEAAGNDPAAVRRALRAMVARGLVERRGLARQFADAGWLDDFALDDFDVGRAIYTLTEPGRCEAERLFGPPA
jgi:hypothetical protein